MKALGLVNLVTFVVVGVNIAIRTINIMLIKCIGYDNETEQTSMVMQSVFWAQFFNTAILLLLSNANLEYSVLAPVPLRLQYPDLTKDWFLDISPQLCKTMFIMAIWPYIELGLFGGIRILNKCLDTSCCTATGTTKAATQFRYVSIWAGPEYLLHFKYSSILTQVFVAFMYGPLLPVLIPQCAFGLFNLYIVEKWSLYYYYRKPPMYDDKLNKEALQLLQTMPPIFLFSFGYWAVGNSQIFFGVAPIKVQSNVQGDPEHGLLNFKGINQTHFALVCALFLITHKFCHSIITACTNCCCKQEDEEDIRGLDIKERLGNYFESISGDVQKNWYADEVYINERFGVKTLPPNSVAALKVCDRKKKEEEAKAAGEPKPLVIEGDSKYDILANLRYQLDFGYQELDMRNQIEDYKTSDMIQ